MTAPCSPCKRQRRSRRGPSPPCSSTPWASSSSTPSPNLSRMEIFQITLIFIINTTLIRQGQGQTRRTTTTSDTTWKETGHTKFLPRRRNFFGSAMCTRRYRAARRAPNRWISGPGAEEEEGRSPRAHLILTSTLCFAALHLVKYIYSKHIQTS